MPRAGAPSVPFGAAATIIRADGASDQVRLVTRIENAYGHHIDIAYDNGLPTIQTITDSMGRVVTFTSAGTPRKLSQVKVTDANGNVYAGGNFRLLDSANMPLANNVAVYTSDPT